MSFTVERSHVVFKHLIHVGPEIDATAVADIATKRGYSKQMRQLNTPTGPLKEFLFRPKTNPQSLIVFSQKGFVVDAKPCDEVLPLFREAYEFYEKIMGDRVMTASVLMDINSKFEVFSPTPVDELLDKLYNEKATKLQFSNRAMRPFGVTLAFGTAQFPHEFIQITFKPLPKDPKRRLLLTALYRSTELDDALKFIETIERDITKFLEKVAKQ